MGKTPHLLIGRSEVVCNILSDALELGWVRLPPCKSTGEKRSASSGVMHWRLGG